MFVGDRLRCLSAIVLVLLCGNVAVSAAAINMSHMCLLMTNNVLIADSSSCSSYYSCQNGVATLQTCSAGNFFDKNQQGCLPQGQVNCMGATTVPCTDHLVGTWAPVSGSCSGYYYCGANGAQRSNCPDGENFNPNTQACVYASDYPCANSVAPGTPDTGVTVSASVNLCGYVKNGIFFGSASTCEGWHYCQNNVMTSGNCQAGMVFNTAIAMCDYPVDVTCSQVTNDPSLTGMASNYGGACTFADTTNFTTLTKAASACNQFYKCNGNYYQLSQCNGGMFYDTVTKTCVSRLNARNSCDRCVGTLNNFVNSYSTTGCTGYLYCQNGIEQSSGTCPSGSYFNEVAGACVQHDQPNFGCCNPQYYNPPSAAAPPAAASGAPAPAPAAAASGAPAPAPAAAAPAPAAAAPAPAAAAPAPAAAAPAPAAAAPAPAAAAPAPAAAAPAPAAAAPAPAAAAPAPAAAAPAPAAAAPAPAAAAPAPAAAAPAPAAAAPAPAAAAPATAAAASA